MGVWVSAGDIKKRGAPRRSMPIFFTLSQANARRLQDVAGGDEARVNFLTTALGQQLVGRPGLTPTQQDLLQVCPQLATVQATLLAVGSRLGHLFISSKIQLITITSNLILQ